MVGNQRRRIADLTESDGVVRTVGDQVQEREAGRILAMPVRVLRQLKRSGHYSKSPIANTRPGYGQRDLEALNRRLVALAPGIRTGKKGSHPADSAVALWKLLAHWKFSGLEAKGCLVAALLDGEMTVAGIEGDDWRALLLRVADVEGFRTRFQNGAERDELSAEAAGRWLGVEGIVASALVRDGLLAQANRTRHWPRGDTCVRGSLRNEVARQPLYYTWHWDPGVGHPSNDWRAWKLGTSNTAQANSRHVFLMEDALQGYSVTRTAA